MPVLLLALSYLLFHWPVFPFIVATWFETLIQAFCLLSFYLRSRKSGLHGDGGDSPILIVIGGFIAIQSIFAIVSGFFFKDQGYPAIGGNPFFWVPLILGMAPFYWNWYRAWRGRDTATFLRELRPQLLIRIVVQQVLIIAGFMAAGAGLPGIIVIAAFVAIRIYFTGKRWTF